jgi:hypothetical protein
LSSISPTSSGSEVRTETAKLQQRMAQRHADDRRTQEARQERVRQERLIDQRRGQNVDRYA